MANESGTIWLPFNIFCNLSWKNKQAQTNNLRRKEKKNNSKRMGFINNLSDKVCVQRCCNSLNCPYLPSVFILRSWKHFFFLPHMQDSQDQNAEQLFQESKMGTLDFFLGGEELVLV